jgi:hypothetical protein
MEIALCLGSKRKMINENVFVCGIPSIMFFNKSSVLFYGYPLQGK